MAKALAIAMQKGGVGKTTTAINLATGFAFKGERVLLVDLDPQGNATSGLGIDSRETEYTLADLFNNSVPPREVLRTTGIKDLKVMPSSMDLSTLRNEGSDGEPDYNVLKEKLSPLQDEFDRWVLDCPPSLGPLTLSGLCAAHELLIPLQAEYYALEGLSQLWRTFQKVKNSLNPGLTLRGILLTMYDRRTNLAEDVKKEVQDHFGDVVFDTVIPRNVRISEAPGYGQPVLTYAPDSSGTKAYLQAVEEVLDREHETTGQGTGRSPADGRDVEPSKS